MRGLTIFWPAFVDHDSSGGIVVSVAGQGCSEAVQRPTRSRPALVWCSAPSVRWFAPLQDSTDGHFPPDGRKNTARNPTPKITIIINPSRKDVHGKREILADDNDGFGQQKMSILPWRADWNEFRSIGLSVSELESSSLQVTAPRWCLVGQYSPNSQQQGLVLSLNIWHRSKWANSLQADSHAKEVPINDVWKLGSNVLRSRVITWSNKVEFPPNVPLALCFLKRKHTHRPFSPRCNWKQWLKLDKALMKIISKVRN